MVVEARKVKEEEEALLLEEVEVLKGEERGYQTNNHTPPGSEWGEKRLSISHNHILINGGGQ